MEVYIFGIKCSRDSVSVDKVLFFLVYDTEIDSITELCELSNVIVFLQM